MKSLISVFAAGIIFASLAGCAQQARNGEMEVFVASHVEKIKPMEKAANLASWDAERSGEAEDFDRLSVVQLELKKVYTDAEKFAYLKELKESGAVTDPKLARELQLLYTGFLRNQIDPELMKQAVELSNEISKKFNTFRGTIDGEQVTDNEIKEILKSETDSAKREKAWLASKQVGQALADDVIKLVKLRNEISQKLGYENYHTFSLTLSEQSVDDLDEIFERLYELTNKPFMEMKAKLDVILSDNSEISLLDLRPWHYHDPFFQETPLVLSLDLDGYYKGKDIKELSREFFAGINLPVESVLAKSDLYEREGKSPHAFCTNIDRRGDVRILCNIKDNEKWMEVQLHELGHAVYSKFYDAEMPYLLRGAAHSSVTEGIAMFFGRLSGNADWMQQMLGLSDEQRDEIAVVSDEYARMKQLIFARWAMVMYNFEKRLYADPDQDLNGLWWELVSKYQFVRAPDGRDEPDWAAKIHIASAPCYYHNYMVGELFGSQLHNYLVENVLGLDSDEGVCYVGEKKVGNYLRMNVFQVGRSLHWNEMVAGATGERLDPKYFVNQFVKERAAVPTADEKMQAFIDRHVAVVDPLFAETNRTLYTAEVTGEKEHFDKLKQLRLQINEVYTNGDDFALLKRLKGSGKVKDHRLRRQLDRLYNAYLGSQMDEQLQKDMIELSTAITEKYNNFRGHIDGEEVSMTEIYRVMTTSKDAEEHRKAWLASKEVGNAIIDDYLRLVKMRNEAVGAIGYPNYHAYSLSTGEQSVEEIDAIFAKLDKLTAGPFAKLKGELDEILAKDYGIAVDELRPWHYHDPFFQRTPLVYELNLDDYYADKDVAKLCIDYFAGVGLDVDDIMARSDLYDKEGKNPHAFAEDVDRRGDVRILANIADDERWMETTLHELGHAVYFKYVDSSAPYLLRQHAHSFTTEAAAMFFGRLSRNAAWMQEMLGLSDAEREEVGKVTFRYLQFQQILFARWAMVMYNFEKAVYADPDQDLNTLWWDLVEKYQFVNRPEGEPDAGWASKLHFTVASCYYHNYMLGELLASQWHDHIVNNILDTGSDVSYVGDKRIGEYFRDEVFAPGAVYHWNEMIERSTGEQLTPKYFAEQFVK